MRNSDYRHSECRAPQMICNPGRQHRAAVTRTLPPPTTVYAIYQGVGLYLVREWRLNTLGQSVEGRGTRHSSLTRARLTIPPGFENVGRDEGDDSSILEVWAWPAR